MITNYRTLILNTVRVQDGKLRGFEFWYIFKSYYTTFGTLSMVLSMCILPSSIYRFRESIENITIWFYFASYEGSEINYICSKGFTENLSRFLFTLIDILLFKYVSWKWPGRLPVIRCFFCKRLRNFWCLERMIGTLFSLVGSDQRMPRYVNANVLLESLFILNRWIN